MAWSDSPTYSQINALLHMVRWEIPIDESIAMGKYLEKNATRKDLSNELGRIKGLIERRKLTKDAVFDSEVWANYQK